MKKWITIAGICCALPLLILAVITLSRKSQTSSEADQSIDTEAGDIASAFELTSIAGKAVSKDTLKGKPTILWFTASYCVPCQIGAKEVKKLDEDMGGNKFNVVMVFIDPRETEKELQWWKNNFASEDWVIAFGNEKIVNDYSIRFLDTQYLLDQDGIIRNIANTNVGYEGYKGKIEPLLK